MKHANAEKMLAYARDAINTKTPWVYWGVIVDGKVQSINEPPDWESDKCYTRLDAVANVAGQLISYVPNPVHGQLYFTPLINDGEAGWTTIHFSIENPHHNRLAAGLMIKSQKSHAAQHADVLIDVARPALGGVASCSSATVDALRAPTWPEIPA